MGKIITILVIGILIVVLIAAIKKKSVSDVIKDADMIEHFPDFEGIKKNLGKIQGKRCTVYITDLEMHEATADGDFYIHTLNKKDMEDAQGRLVGIPISHPGADCNGIKLKGKKNFLGLHNKRDPSFTVNTGAVCIGYDENGFYGEVTNPHATVYEVINEKETKRVPYGEHFDIVDNKYILIGKQWLIFKIPSLPEFPGTKSLSRAVADILPDAPPVQMPGFKNAQPKGMKKRVPDTKSYEGGSNTETTPEENFSIRFPADE